MPEKLVNTDSVDDSENAEIGNLAAENSAPDQGEESDDVSRETFPAKYVKQLRKENAGYRTRAERANALEAENSALAVRLHTSLVARDGRLADPADLPFNPEFLEDEQALTNAITELIRARPGLKARSAAGDIGHGNRGTANTKPASLIDMLRGAQ